MESICYDCKNLIILLRYDMHRATEINCVIFKFAPCSYFVHA